MTDEERQAFIDISSGFHHGERQVEVDLVPFMMAGSEDEKIYISSQIEDEARHTVFFDRFYKEVVGVEGDTIMDVLDQLVQLDHRDLRRTVRTARVPRGRPALESRKTRTGA